MDYPKMPYLTEEILRTQRVEVYLQDLKDRLQQLRQKHNEVIENSVEIIKELDEVSSSLLSQNRSTAITTSTTNNRLQDNVTKIKKLINEFETVKESSSTRLPVAVENRVNIRHILQNFEHLNDSHMLKESLVLFRKAKESFEKIDKLFGKLECLEGANTNNDMKVRRLPMRPMHLDNGVRNKINLFNQTQFVREAKRDVVNDSNDGKICNNEPPQKEEENTANEPSNDVTNATCEDLNLNYVSCCSSLISLGKYHSAHNLIKNQTSVHSVSMENGYDGDNDDSEFNLLDTKKRKCGY